MKKLLEKAAKVADQAEVYSVRQDSGSIEMRNGIPTDISASIQSGYALRILKNGMIGTAYTKNLLDRDQLVSNAMDSLKGEVEAGFSFPGAADLPDSAGADPGVEKMGFRELHTYADGVLEQLRGKVEGQIDVYAGRGVEEVSVVNTTGLDVCTRSSDMYLYASLLFPNTEASVHRLHIDRKAGAFPEGELDDLIALYKSGLPEVEVDSGRMKVMFMPDTLYTLLWRIGAATSGKSLYNRISPLQDKRGQRVLSEKFSYYGHANDPDNYEQRYFDDEGVPTRKHMVIDQGVFSGAILNLDYATKLGENPSGTGYRRDGEPVSALPSPYLAGGRIAPGKRSLAEMIREMDRGVIILGVLGAHSGNILNGDFSVGLNPGFYVENGEILGRVRDGMVAGNVYDVLQNVVAIENHLNTSLMGGKYPALLLDDVSVAAKK